MDSHLVTVEVSVERLTNERVQLNRLTVYQSRLERLNTEAVQGWRTVQKNRMLLDNLFQCVPHFRASSCRSCAWRS